MAEFYDARQGLYLPKFGEAVLGGLKSGQDLRKGALEMQKTQAETAKLNAEMQPNTGIAALGQSEWAQKVNAQMQAYIQAGYPPTQDTYRKAINDVQATSVQQYTDPMGNRVSIGGVPLPQVGALGVPAGQPIQQPVLGGQQFSTQQPALAPYGTGDKLSQADKIVSSIQDDIASATPEEKSFVNEVMLSPNPAQTYNAKVRGHPELAQVQPEWNDTVAQHFSELNAAMNEVVPTGAVLPPIQQRVSPQDAASPLAQVERVKQEVGKEELQNATRSKIEEKLLNSTEALSRLKAIKSSFNPEYLKLGTRLGVAATSMKEFAGAKIYPEESKQLSDFTGFKRSSVDNMNRLLNELSGAAVSPNEAERLKASQPNAGTGVFDGDSPTVFKRKMDDVTKQMQYATLRYNYALRNGMNPLKTGISLDTIPSLIEKRGAEIERQIKRNNPNLQQDAIDMQTKLQLGQEFGMQ